MSKLSLKVEDVNKAGIYYPKLPTDTTAYAIRTEQKPTTPHDIKKWRSTFTEPPGTHNIHPGLIDDHVILKEERSKLPPECQAFGSKKVESDHVPQLFNDQIKGPASKFIEETKESVYASRAREPLGRPLKYNYMLPDEAQNPGFSFGVPTIFSESAKNLLYPNEIPPNGKESHDLYVTSHHSYDVSEPIHRNYNWPNGVNPQDFRFGRFDKHIYEESRYCLKPTTDPNRNIPNIVKKEVEDSKAAGNSDTKAKSTGLGIGYDKNRVYGLPGKGKGDWGALDCIQGNYSLKDQLPDDNVGRSTRVGCRNITTETRSFGIPTIRNDIPEPRFKSIADSQNYGNEPGMYSLTNPDVYSYQGLYDVEFIQPRSQEDIKIIFDKIGYGVSDSEFEQIWNHAQQNIFTPPGYVSVHEYRLALNEFLSFKDEGEYPSWWKV